jgi:chemotaxis protein CheX
MRASRLLPTRYLEEDRVIPTEHIAELVSNVWSTMLGTELLAMDPGPVAVPPTLVSACVQITGDWEGTVLLQCSLGYAGVLAGRMFEMGPDEVSPEEVRDAMGELVNMVGGNFKGLLSCPAQISLPTVVEGGTYSIRIKGASLANSLQFDDGGDPLLVQVYAREA